jgi:hypothetical protein
VRFLLDEAIQHRLADHLAEAGHDATHVLRIGLGGASDPEVLARGRRGPHPHHHGHRLPDAARPLRRADPERAPPPRRQRQHPGSTGGDRQRLAVDTGGARVGRGRRRGAGPGAAAIPPDRADLRDVLPPAHATHGWLTTWLTHGSRTSADHRPTARSGRSCVRSSSASRTPGVPIPPAAVRTSIENRSHDG